jgi:hypothetical protein
MKTNICIFIVLCCLSTIAIAQERVVMQSDAFAYSIYDADHDTWSEWTEWAPSEIQIDIVGNTFVVHIEPACTFTVTETFPEYTAEDGSTVLLRNTTDDEGISCQVGLMVHPDEPYGYFHVEYADAKVMYRLIKE